jgi:hemerythrin
MKKIEITPDDVAGLEHINQQHIDIANAINKLIDMSRRNFTREELENFLVEVKKQIVQHFQDEEKFMIDSNFPNYETHKKQHTECIETVQELIKVFESQKNIKFFIKHIINVLSFWLLEHVDHHDTFFFRYYQKNNPSKNNDN